MMSPIQKQGYLGDITSKSTAELMDLASRQEKILRKTIFVESLPDKGAKVRAFYEKLQQLLLARNQQVDGISPQTKDASQLKSECAPAAVLGDKQEQALHDSSLQNETQQNITTIGTRNISSSEDEIRLQENKRNQAVPLSTASKITLSQADHSSSEVEMNTVINITESENQGNVKDPDLEESLKNMKISGEVSMMDRIEKEKTTNAYSKVLQNAVEVHFPLKPNNYLKKTKISDLPREYKFKSRDEGNVSCVRINPRSQAVEESAATPPSYKHKESKLIPIDESLILQKEQKVKQEELLARHAAEKLSQRLGVKMEAYNPEGVDMSYRNQEEDVDSDDELE